MLKIGNLKSGDIITVNDEGMMREGTVVNVSQEENQALVDNGVQEFWYTPEEMSPVPLDESQLLKLGFTREESDGTVKYKKDSFRLVTPKKDEQKELALGLTTVRARSMTRRAIALQLV